MLITNASRLGCFFCYFFLRAKIVPNSTFRPLSISSQGGDHFSNIVSYLYYRFGLSVQLLFFIPSCIGGYLKIFLLLVLHLFTKTIKYSLLAK